MASSLDLPSQRARKPVKYPHFYQYTDQQLHDIWQSKYCTTGQRSFAKRILNQRQGHTRTGSTMRQQRARIVNQLHMILAGAEKNLQRIDFELRKLQQRFFSCSELEEANTLSELSLFVRQNATRLQGTVDYIKDAYPNKAKQSKDVRRS